MTDQKNLVLAIVLSIAIVLGFEFFYNMPKNERERALQAERAAQQQTTSQPVTTPSQPGAPPAPGVIAAPVVPATPPAVQPRVRIQTPQVEGSILLAGGVLDDLTLNKYRQTTEPGSPPIRLLSPAGTENAYFAEAGWVSGTAGVDVARTDDDLDRRPPDAHARPARDAELGQWPGLALRAALRDRGRISVPRHAARDQHRRAHRSSFSLTRAPRAPVRRTRRASTSCMKARSASPATDCRSRPTTP